MTDRPILFSAPMVRALLDGRKTQTRRVLKPQPPKDEDFPGSFFGLGRKVADGIKCHSLNDYDRTPKHPTKWDLDGSVGVARNAGFPMIYDTRYAVGDRLWVRETWQGLTFGDYLPTKHYPCDLRYFATDSCADLDADVRGYPWRPSIFMPRWASRLTLIVTDVRVERLRDISEADAIAEGVNVGKPMPEIVPGSIGDIYHDGMTDPEYGWTRDPRLAYARLWNAINGPGAWSDNPWVVALTFDVEQRNIDAEGRS